jgi:hypothetical protein
MPTMADLARMPGFAMERSPHGWQALGYTPPVAPIWEPGRLYDYTPGMGVGSTYDPTIAPVTATGDRRAEYLRDRQRRDAKAAQAAAWSTNPAITDPRYGENPELFHTIYGVPYYDQPKPIADPLNRKPIPDRYERPVPDYQREVSVAPYGPTSTWDATVQGVTGGTTRDDWQALQQRQQRNASLAPSAEPIRLSRPVRPQQFSPWGASQTPSWQTGETAVRRRRPQGTSLNLSDF